MGKRNAQSLGIKKFFFLNFISYKILEDWKNCDQFFLRIFVGVEKHTFFNSNLQHLVMLPTGGMNYLVQQFFLI